jgi:hypothetical protein
MRPANATVAKNAPLFRISTEESCLTPHPPKRETPSPTPADAATFSTKGLFRFDAKAGQWDMLPWNGPKPEGVWSDGDGDVCDFKRDCLWIGIGKSNYRHKMADGNGEKTVIARADSETSGDRQATGCHSPAFQG